MDRPRHHVRVAAAGGGGSFLAGGGAGGDLLRAVAAASPSPRGPTLWLTTLGRGGGCGRDVVVIRWGQPPLFGGWALAAA